MTVGVLAYPSERPPRCVVGPPAGTSLPGLDIEVVPLLEPVSAGGVEPLQLTVVLTNVGDTPIRFGSGTAIGTILGPSGNVVSNSATVAIGDAGIGVDLAPGVSTELPLVVNTASCDPRLGYTVPPGDYLVVAGSRTQTAPSRRCILRPLPIVVAG